MSTPTTPTVNSRETAARRRLEVTTRNLENLRAVVARTAERLDKQRADLHLATLEHEHAASSPHLEATYVRDHLDAGNVTVDPAAVTTEAPLEADVDEFDTVNA